MAKLIIIDPGGAESLGERRECLQILALGFGCMQWTSCLCVWPSSMQHMGNLTHYMKLYLKGIWELRYMGCQVFGELVKRYLHKRSISLSRHFKITKTKLLFITSPGMPKPMFFFQHKKINIYVKTVDI